MSDAITIIICTRNRPGVLGAALRRTLVEIEPHDKIVIVEQSDEALRVSDTLWQKDARVERVFDAPRGLPAARNLGLSRVQTPLVCFIDDDFLWMKGALYALRSVFSEPKVGGASPRIEERRGQLNAWATVCGLGRDGRVRVRLTGAERVALDTLKGACMAFRTDQLRAAGPCDEGYRGNFFLEDADWSYRISKAGSQLVFVPEAVGVHLSAPAEGCRVSEPWRYDLYRLRNTARFLHKYPETAGLTAKPVQALIALRALVRACSWEAAWPIARACVSRQGEGR